MNVNDLKYTEVDPTEFPYSRYRKLDRITNAEGDYFVETYEELNIPQTNSDKFHEVKAGEDNRLDLIAYKYYRNPSLWWVIAEANNIIDPIKVEVGEVLRIPPRETIFGYGGVLA